MAFCNVAPWPPWLAKSGTRPISGLLKPGIRPPEPGLYLMSEVSDGPVRFGYPNINDTATIVEMICLRLLRHFVFDRPRVGRRLGHRAGHQGLRQSADL